MITVFSSSGCLRCRIVKNHLQSLGLAYTEHDIKTEEGKAAFLPFYHANRSRVQRDGQGIFFPIVQDGATIVQDAGPSLAWFVAGRELAEIIRPNNLGHGWSGGLAIRNYGDKLDTAFLDVVRLMKNGGLHIEAESGGENPSLLGALLAETLLDRLIFRMPCPGTDDATERSLSVAAAAPGLDVRVLLDLAAFPSSDGMPDKGAVAEAARIIREATGNARIPCTVIHSSAGGINLLPYRTAIRRWLAAAEVA